MDNKFCPLKFVAPTGHVTLDCDSRCAWLLDNGRCAITEIAIRLQEKKKK